MNANSAYMKAIYQEQKAQAEAGYDLSQLYKNHPGLFRNGQTTIPTSYLYMQSLWKSL